MHEKNGAPMSQSQRGRVAVLVAFPLLFIKLIFVTLSCCWS